MARRSLRRLGMGGELPPLPAKLRHRTARLAEGTVRARQAAFRAFIEAAVDICVPSEVRAALPLALHGGHGFRETATYQHSACTALHPQYSQLCL